MKRIILTKKKRKKNKSNLDLSSKPKLSNLFITSGPLFSKSNGINPALFQMME